MFKEFSQNSMRSTWILLFCPMFICKLNLEKNSLQSPRGLGLSLKNRFVWESVSSFAFKVKFAVKGRKKDTHYQRESKKA